MSEKLALTLALGSLPTPIVPSSPASQPGMVTSNCHPGAGVGAGGGGGGRRRQIRGARRGARQRQGGKRPQHSQFIHASPLRLKSASNAPASTRQNEPPIRRVCRAARKFAQVVGNIIEGLAFVNAADTVPADAPRLARKPITSWARLRVRAKLGYIYQSIGRRAGRPVTEGGKPLVRAAGPRSAFAPAAQIGESTAAGGLHLAHDVRR